MTACTRAFEPSAIASLATQTDASEFAAELLRRADRAVGFDVAYHAVLQPDGTPPAGFAARLGLDDRIVGEILGDRAAVYSAELSPVKAAAIRDGGVAVDSEVFRRGERDARAYYRDLMRPDGGEHAMFVLGLFRSRVVSVTMLGRAGRAFAGTDVRTMRQLVPVLGLAAAASSNPTAGGALPRGPSNASLSPSLSLSDRERDLVDYVALGLTNAEIAQIRGTSPRTVRNQLSALYARLVVANRAELVSVVRGRPI